MINYSYLRPTKANQLKMLHNNELFKNDSLDARLYDNATVLPLKKFANDTLVWGRGGLVDSNGDYVCDSGIDGFVNDAYDYSNSDYIDEKVAYCGYLRFEWGHLIVDCSTRLYYVLQHYNEIDHFVFFIDENAKRELYGNFKEFFELSGIIDKLLIINKPTKFNRIIVPTKSYDRHKKYCYKDLYSLIFDTIRNSESVSHNTSLQYEKIYFSRSKLTNAQKLEFGHDLLDAFL